MRRSWWWLVVELEVAVKSGAMTARAAWQGSYLLGNDTLTGWGPRYYFSFYSELGARGAAPAWEAAALASVFAGSLVANGGVAAAVLRYRQMRTVTNCFLLNLAVADVLFASGIPAVILARINSSWRLGDLLCRLLPYSQLVCGFVLLWTLTLISMDRHRCLAVPPYRSRLTPRRAALLTAATWAIALALFLPVALWFREEPTLRICTIVFPRSDAVSVSVVFTVVALLLTCVLPMSLLVYHYQRIFSKLLKTRRRWLSHARVSPPQPHSHTTRQPKPSLTHHEEMRMRKHAHVLRVVLLNVVVVLHMWLPIAVVVLLIYVDGHRPLEDTAFFLRSHHLLWALMVAYLNTLVNPLLYGLMSEHFRARFSHLWFGSRRRRAAARALTLDASASRAHQGSPSQVPAAVVRPPIDPWPRPSCPASAVSLNALSSTAILS